MSSFAQPILETLGASGLDLEQTLVVGSSVLGLLDIRQPNDLDLKVSPQWYLALNARLETPGGIELHPIRKPLDREEGLKSYADSDRGLLGLDIHPFAGTAKEANALFEAALEESEEHTTEIGLVRAHSLATVRKLKAENHRRLKDAQDVRLIDEWLRKAA